MDPNHYRFRGLWHLPAPPPAVYAALEDVAGYPRWWPEVRETRQTGPDTGDVVIRAVLPYQLVITLEARRRDPAAGVLEVAMSGDLAGWTRFTVTPQEHGGAGSQVLFEEEARPGKALLRRLAMPLHPVFRANHAVMMWRGRRGLAAHLAADRAGVSLPAQRDASWTPGHSRGRIAGR